MVTWLSKRKHRMEEERFQVPDKIPKNRINDSLYFISQNEFILSFLYNNQINKKNFIDFLISLTENIPITDSGQRILVWYLFCVINRFIYCAENENLKLGDLSQNLRFNEIEKYFSQDILKTIKDPVVSFILPFLNNEKKINMKNEADIHNLSFYLLVFSESYPGIFEVLYETKFKSIINEISVSKLFEILGTDFLYILKEPPIQFLKTTPIDLADAPMFFKSQTNYTNLGFSQILQKRLSLQVQFPDEFPSVFHSNFFTLLNTTLTDLIDDKGVAVFDKTGSSISNNTHFIDVVCHLVLEHLTIGEFEQIPSLDFKFLSDENYDASINSVVKTNSIIPFILCAYQQLLYSDLPNSIVLLDLLKLNTDKKKQPSKQQAQSQQTTTKSILVSKFMNVAGKSMQSNNDNTLNNSSPSDVYCLNSKNVDLAVDLLNRFKNDQELATMISFLTSVETNVNDLANMSIPKHLEFVLSHKEILTNYADMKFFLYSDENTSKDFDFIRCYSIFKSFLSNFPTTSITSPSQPNKKGSNYSNNKLNICFQEISEMFRQIKSNDIKQSICIDLFSMLFYKSSSKQINNNANKTSNANSVKSNNNDCCEPFVIKDLNFAKNLLNILCLYTDCKYITDSLLRLTKLQQTISNSSSASSILLSNLSSVGEFGLMFIRDPKELFSALGKHKYKAAYELARNGIMPKLFTLAYSMQLVLHKHQIPIEAVDFLDLLNFEVSLSIGKEGLLPFGYNANLNLNVIESSIHQIKSLSSSATSKKAKEFAVLNEIQSVEFEEIEDLSEIINNLSEKYFSMSDKDIIKGEILKIMENRAKDEIDPKWVIIRNFAQNFNANKNVNGDKFDDMYFYGNKSTANEKKVEERYKRFIEFLIYLNKYYSFAMLCPQIEQDNIFSYSDDLNVLVPLSGILNSGNTDKAEEFCKFYNINLFDIVMENTDIFYINDSFLEKYESKYPLEIRAIKESRKIENDSINVSSFIKNRRSNRSDNENENNSINTNEQSIYYIIEKVKRNEKVDFDETDFYNIDPIRLYNLLFNDIHLNLSNLNNYYMTKNEKDTLINKYIDEFNGEMCDLLKMIDYVAPNEDLPIIKTIYLKNTKAKYGLKDDKDQLKHIAEFGNIDEVIDFMRSKEIQNEKQNSNDYNNNFRNENSNENESLIYILINGELSNSNFLNDVENVEKLFFNFPNHFKMMAQKFCTYGEDFLQLIEKYAPRNEKRYIRSYINLPKLIKENAKVYNKPSLISAFVKNPEILFQLSFEQLNSSTISSSTSSSSTVLTDEIKFEIITHISSSSSLFNFKLYNKYVSFLLPYFEVKKEIEVDWLKKTYSYIQSIEIDSIEKEEIALLNIRSIESVLVQISDHQINESRIECIRKFLMIRIYRNYQQIYNFSSFGKDAETNNKNELSNKNLKTNSIIRGSSKYFDQREIYDSSKNIAEIILNENERNNKIKCEKELSTNKETFSEYLIYFINKYDLSPSLEDRVKKAFNVRESVSDNYIVHRALKQIQLGLIQDARKTIQTRSKSNQVNLNDNNKSMANENNNKILIDRVFHYHGQTRPRVNLEHPFYSSMCLYSVFDTNFILSSFFPKNTLIKYQEQISQLLPQNDAKNGTQNKGKVKLQNKVSNIFKEEELIDNDKFQNLTYNHLNYIKEIININNPSNNNLNKTHSNEKSPLISKSNSMNSLNTTNSNRILLPIEMKFYATHFSSVPGSLTLLVATNNYSNAYQVLMSIQGSDHVLNYFVHNFFPSSFIYSNVKSSLNANNNSTSQIGQTTSSSVSLNSLPKMLISDDPMKLLNFLKSQDSDFLLLGPFFDALTSFLEDRNANCVLTTILFFMNRFEDSAKSAIKAFYSNFKYPTLFNPLDERSRTYKMYYLQHAKNCLEQGLLMRKKLEKKPSLQSKSLNPLLFSQNETTESIKKLKAKVDIQFDICTFFFEEKIDHFDNDKYDLLNKGDEAAINCCAFFLIKLKSEFYERIVTTISKSPNKAQISLFRKLAKELSKKSVKEIEEFTKFYSIIMPKYARMIKKLRPQLMKEISTTENWSSMIDLIISVEKPLRKMQFFIEFDFLAEAMGVLFAECSKDQVNEFSPLIAHRAALLGNNDLLDQIAQMNILK